MSLDTQKNENKSGKSVWHGVKTESCVGKVTLKEDYLIKEVEHPCVPDMSHSLEVIKSVSNAKKGAREEDDTSVSQNAVQLKIGLTLQRNAPADWRQPRQITSRNPGRILYDIPCRVCQDHSSGKHYGIFACDGCAGFFKRSIRRNRQYVCKAKGEGACLVDKTHRNQCRSCRLRKCLEAGMNKDAVQHERGPRNSTLRRQMCLLLKPEPSGPGAGGGGLGPGPSSQEELAAKLRGHLSAVAQGAGAHVYQSSPLSFFHPAHHHHHVLAASTPPSPSSSPLSGQGEVLSSPETICESAARLLFMNVRWAKNVPAFTGLNLKDQLTLLEDSWRELFLLGCAQLLPPLDLASLAAPDRLQEATLFQETLATLRTLSLDHHEFACLRAILLFKTALDGEGKSLTDVAWVAALQDHTQVTLSKYMSAAYPERPYRFGKVLLYLPALRSVPPAAIEELFFRRTIGPIPIERIICDMYQSNSEL